MKGRATTATFGGQPCWRDRASREVHLRRAAATVDNLRAKVGSPTVARSRLGERKLERETGFEPATSTLARSHSTTELFPPERPKYHTVPLAFKPGGARQRHDIFTIFSRRAGLLPL